MIDKRSNNTLQLIYISDQIPCRCHLELLQHRLLFRKTAVVLTPDFVLSWVSDDLPPPKTTHNHSTPLPRPPFSPSRKTTLIWPPHPGVAPRGPWWLFRAIKRWTASRKPPSFPSLLTPSSSFFLFLPFNPPPSYSSFPFLLFSLLLLL